VTTVTPSFFEEKGPHRGRSPSKKLEPRRGGRERTTVVAVDFGASSIRVCRVELGDGPPELDVVHRYAHGPVADSRGHLRWDWPRLVAETEQGLLAALAKGPVASIGIDTWGVDYGLLDGRGRLLSPPFSYRDRRTDGYRQVVERIGEDELYATTGVQLQPFNTIFQLAAHAPADKGDELTRARHLLVLPELLVHHLTGEVHAERTSAGTTALVDVASGNWADPLLDAIGLRPDLLSPIEPAGTPAGTWMGVPVHLVGGHDTASAVVAMGAPRPGAGFVSAGTWLLVGRERDMPETSDAARRANFTNEPGALGGVRFLKNLAGAWLLEGCRSAWGDPPVEDLLTAAAGVEQDVPIVDVTDPRFLHPTDMLSEVTGAAGLATDTAPPVVVRCLVESMAAGTAIVLDQLGDVTEVHVFGGAQSELFRTRLSDRTGLPVVPGPVEATALGNALVQGIALGLFPDLAAARATLPRNLGSGGSPGASPAEVSTGTTGRVR
jgi:rhamnulokinase